MKRLLRGLSIYTQNTLEKCSVSLICANMRRSIKKNFCISHHCSTCFSWNPGMPYDITRDEFSVEKHVKWRLSEKVFLFKKKNLISFSAQCLLWPHLLCIIHSVLELFPMAELCSLFQPATLWPALNLSESPDGKFGNSFMSRQSWCFYAALKIHFYLLFPMLRWSPAPWPHSLHPQNLFHYETTSYASGPARVWLTQITSGCS